jgi:ABC-type Fe3+-hydroxamate transport system substrate-binding protein
MSSGEGKKLAEVYKEWKTLKAVRNKKVVVVDPDLYLRPGSRFIEALENLFRNIHRH